MPDRTLTIHPNADSAWPDLATRQVIRTDVIEAAYRPPKPARPDPKGGPPKPPEPPAVVLRFGLQVGHDLLAYLQAGGPVVLATLSLEQLEAALLACRDREAVARFARWAREHLEAAPSLTEPPAPGQAPG